MPTVELKAKQVRAHNSVKGKVNFYLVVGDGETGKPRHIIWWRSEQSGDKEPMYLVVDAVNRSKWKLEDDPVIMDNMGEAAQHFRDHLDPNVPDPDVIAYIKDGQIVKAIKKVRDDQGIGLKEAKEYVDDLRRAV